VRRFHVPRDAGQAIAIMVLSMSVVVMTAGIAVDGGYALVQRRTAQNAADFSALAGSRIVAIWIADNTNDGTDANVKSAINAALASNGGATVTYGATGSPVYVSEDGSVLGYVGSGTIPSFSVGIRVTVTKSWAPYFLKILGVSGWSASATATARGGYYAQRIPGAVFPAGIAEAFFNHRQPCSAGAINTTDSNDACYPKKLTPGTLNVPGGFGWLKFGCDGYGLGQAPPANTDGCATNLGFLQQQIGPPANSYGCCDTVGQPGSPDRIGSLPGNKTPADCSYWIATGKTLPVPVWDYAGGTGSNAWYHIVGYTGFQITDCDGGKSLSGVWRQPFFLGPTTTAPGFAGAPLAVQLIK
jgi:Putative Flp pilus-assembly TadE/G-like